MVFAKTSSGDRSFQAKKLIGLMLFAFLWMVINKRLEMRLNIRTHRRNKAFQEIDQCLRLSFAPVQTPITPSSLRKSFQPSENFRNSDLSCFANRNSISQKRQICSKDLVPEQFEPKNGSSLIQSLKCLSSKLADANNLLKRQGVQPQKLKHNQLIPLQNQMQPCKSDISCRKIDENEESTLNLESRKLLKKNANCKQKIVSANALKLYYIGPVVRGMVGINDRAYEHLYQSQQFFLQNATFVPPKMFSTINLQCNPNEKLKKVLVIDLDQTLIHCEMQYSSNCEIEVQLGDDEKGYISIRPYALSFLKKMSKSFQIIVFTAGSKDYADSILNQLDPQRLIKHRLYRENCLKMSKNLFTKDLRIINRDLSQMILVDNSAASFLCQPENGVPILPYLGGEDRELLDLQKYLQLLLKEEDVRKLNRNTFKLQRYRQFEKCQDLAAQLYEDQNSYY